MDQNGRPDPREGKSLVQKKIDFEAAKKYWAYQPLAKPQPPQNQNRELGPIGHRPVSAGEDGSRRHHTRADADPLALIRRVYFDLVGLPPTPGQVEEYTRQSHARPTSPRLWIGCWIRRSSASAGAGIGWMSSATANPPAWNGTTPIPQAWRYRDYVIRVHQRRQTLRPLPHRANRGRPAARQNPRRTPGTSGGHGLLAIGPKSLNERNREQFAMDVVDDQIDVTSRAFLGLTVACARCHDHKFDAIPQNEYYAIAGIFRSTETYYGTGGGAGNRQNGELLALEGSEDPHRQTRWRTAKATTRKKSKTSPTKTASWKNNSPTCKNARKPPPSKNASPNFEEQQAKLKRQLAKARKGDDEEPEEKPAKDQTLIMGVLDSDKPSDTEVRLRGEPDDRGDTIPRGFLTVASRFDVPKIPESHSGRLELAQWIADPKNPLTARVAVNRFWQHLFGRGIVGTVNNFGNNGEKPTHPELLDYLASDFIQNGWSLKHFVRSVVLSRAYQLSCQSHEAGLAADPDNHLLWRQNQRRLEAEAVRDAMLLASGELDLTPAKASIVARVGDGDVGRNLRVSQFETDNTKRSVYLPIVRSAVPEGLAVFDFPEPSIIAGQRDVTTVPTQALYMLNSPFVLDRSKKLAQRLLKDDSLTTDPSRITRAFRYTLCREPSPEELASAEKFISEAVPLSDTRDMEPRLKAWMGFCHVLLASSEFRYLQ